MTGRMKVIEPTTGVEFDVAADSPQAKVWGELDKPKSKPAPVKGGKAKSEKK